MRTRFAPSPTGYMHLGHVVNAIYVWGMARARGGEVLLRVEDHDRIRSRPEFETALVEDLDWLGFVPDAGRHPVWRQSDNPNVYQEALDHLRLTQHVYACGCSRKDIGNERYDGRCRSRGLAFGPGTGIRIEMPDGGDLLLRDRDGHWTYQFSVVVDDVRQAITHVIRGEDIAVSTGAQIVLAQMLGRTVPPAFVHHRLIIKTDGSKLSKSAADTGIRELRAAGLAPAAVIGCAAAAVRLIDQEHTLSALEVAALFR